jgi:hypothetical protein
MLATTRPIDTLRKDLGRNWLMFRVSQGVAVVPKDSQEHKAPGLGKGLCVLRKGKCHVLAEGMPVRGRNKKVRVACPRVPLVFGNV